MVTRRRRLSLALIVAGLMTPFGLGHDARASAVAAIATSLSVEGPASVFAGQQVVLAFVLRTASGDPVPDALVRLYVDGSQEARRLTDIEGKARASVTADLSIGTHLFRAVFDGTERYATSSMTLPIEVEQPVLTIQTLPALEGVTFSYRGNTFASNADGVARLELDTFADRNDAPQVVSVPSTSSQRVEFDRFWGSAPSLRATFDIYYRISMRFTERLGNPVDPDSISNIALRSSIGEVLAVKSDGPFWVHGVRVVSLIGGLEVKDILYGVDEVAIEGSNTVNKSQQRFIPREGTDWNVELLFYKTSIELTDALMSLPISTVVRVEYPSGRTFRVTSDEHGRVELPPLPRGTYIVTPERAGLTVSRPVTMSRDASVRLAVITYLDIAIALGIPLAIAVLLLLIGRPTILRTLRTRVENVRARARHGGARP